MWRCGRQHTPSWQGTEMSVRGPSIRCVVMTNGSTQWQGGGGDGSKQGRRRVRDFGTSARLGASASAKAYVGAQTHPFHAADAPTCNGPATWQLPQPSRPPHPPPARAGAGVARALGSAGATVYVTGRSVRGGAPPADGAAGTVQDTADEVTRRGGRGVAVPVDHTSDEQARASQRP